MPSTTTAQSVGPLSPARASRTWVAPDSSHSTTFAFASSSMRAISRVVERGFMGTATMPPRRMPK